MKKDFLAALRRATSKKTIPVIPDFKMISPATGPLFAQRDPVTAAVEMARAGAPALSVVTEGPRFGGSLELLRDIAEAADVPVLRKDFIQSPHDVEETAAVGASAVLLICASMSEETLRQCYSTALRLGLEPLVEAHTAKELLLAGSLGCRLVGINNRDIQTLETDGGTVQRTVSLAALKPPGAFLISESGLQSPQDIQKAIRSGADGALVGTAIWLSPNPFAFYQTLCDPETAP